MAALNNIINLVSCGSGAVLGTGLKGCRPFLKKVTALAFVPSGFKFDGTRELSQEYLEEVQDAGNLIMLGGIRTFTDNTPDNTNEELEDGTLQLTRLGLYQFNVKFINGLYFNKALASLSGYGSYDVIMIDGSGNVLGTEANDGSLKGLTVGMIQSDKLQFATDSAGQREGLTFQLLDRAELDSEYVFIQGSQLDFNFNRLPGINQVELSYPTTPVTGATTLRVKAVMAQDGHALVGAVAANFLVDINGVSAAPSAATEVSDGIYDLTVPALSLNDGVTTQLYNSVLNQNVVRLDTDGYKSNEAYTVVVAA